MLYLRLSLPTLGLLVCASHAALANTIQATVFCNVSASQAGNTPAPGAAIAGTQCATFQSTGLMFANDSGSGNNTIGGFINSYNNTSSNGILGAVTYLNGFTSSSTLDFSVFSFTGTAFFVNGQTYSVQHDDGTVMQVNGVTVINSPAQTSPRVDTFVFSGPTNNYNFAYNYSEYLGGAEYATNAAVSPVSEPASLLLMGTGVLGTASVLCRRRLGYA